MNWIDAIKARRSVRTYTGQVLSDTHLKSIETELKKLSEAHGVQLTLVKNNFQGKQFGTYGIIKNPAAYIVCVCQNKRPVLLQAGMALERAILICTTLGIGTCWLGGTFKREEFGSAISATGCDIIPAVVAAGYPSEKESLIGGLLRKGAKSGTRKPFDTLFFDSDFSHPLSKEDAFSGALEMVRIGPSASNKQPWRAVKNGEGCHFFLEHTPAYAARFAFDMQLLDMGIAMAHFELAMEVAGKRGTWQMHEKSFGNLPPNTEYIATWIVTQ